MGCGRENSALVRRGSVGTINAVMVQVGIAKGGSNSLAVALQMAANGMRPLICVQLGYRTHYHIYVYKDKFLSLIGCSTGRPVLSQTCSYNKRFTDLILD